jgi:hypothetical protein
MMLEFLEPLLGPVPVDRVEVAEDPRGDQRQPLGQHVEAGFRGVDLHPPGGDALPQPHQEALADIVCIEGW